MKTSKNVCLLKAGERLDDLQRNGYEIIQNPDKFCFGIDAVLLSGFAHAGAKDRVLDIGTGTGIIPILLAAKTNAPSIVGLEIQEDMAEMASRSVLHNALENRVQIVHGDIRQGTELFGKDTFSVITSNPPYMIQNHGLENQQESVSIARHEVTCSLEDIISQGSQLLKVRGKFFMVHRPFRLVEILGTFTKYGLEPKRIRFVHPYVDKEPNLLLIEAMKGGKPRVTVEKPLIVYDKPNVYSDEILRCYKQEMEK